MNSDDLLKEVRGIIAGVLDQPDLQITRDTTAEDVRNWDSFNHINIVVAVQSHFGIKIRTSEVEELHRISELVDLVQRKLAAKK